MEVDVEILDVNEEEARQLLLTIDPLASLAEEQDQIRQRLLDITPAQNPNLQAAWRLTADTLLDTPHPDRPAIQSIPEQFLILITCRDEMH